MIVTVVPNGTAPAPGLKVGAATAGAIVYAAIATVLSVIPASYAMALIVSATFTVMVTGDATPFVALGVLPLVV